MKLMPTHAYGEAFNEKSTLPVVMHEGVNILLWGCVAAGGTCKTLYYGGRESSAHYS